MYDNELDRFEIEEQIELLREEIETSNISNKEELLQEIDEIFEIYDNFEWDMLEHYKNCEFNDDEDISSDATVRIEKMLEEWENIFPQERIEEIQNQIKN